jgi:hypothetical protein
MSTCNEGGTMTEASETRPEATPTGPSASPDEYYEVDTVDEFARRHRISRAQVYKEVAAGKLIASKLGKRTIITREHAAEWRRALPRMSSPGKDSTIGRPKRKAEAEAPGPEAA